MLTGGEIDNAFQTYWDDMQRCRNGRAYWSLLHVTVCIPDICAALESSDGRTTGNRYIRWCNTYLADALLTGRERYMMRCKVLHEGRAKTGQRGRYSGHAFTQPDANGHAVDHKRVEGTTLVLEVGTLSGEYQNAVRHWSQVIEGQPMAPIARNVERNLQTIVRVRQQRVSAPMPGGFTMNNRTN